MAVRVLEQGWTLAPAASAACASVRTASKWVARYRAEGDDGLADRSSEPLSIPNRTREERVELIAFLRRLRMTGAEIAEVIGMPGSTVSAVLTRIGLGKLSRLEPVEPPNRYEKQLPGELIHIDVKKLVRIEKAGHRVTGNRRGSRQGIGWEYVHVCVDDATRLAYVEVLPDEKAATAVGFLRRAVAHYAAYGIRVQKVLTDNGPAYISILHKLACTTLGIRHGRTRLYRPRTNGKAERFIRTMLGGWAYGYLVAGQPLTHWTKNGSVCELFRSKRWSTQDVLRHHYKAFRGDKREYGKLTRLPAHINTTLIADETLPAPLDKWAIKAIRVEPDPPDESHWHTIKDGEMVLGPA